MNSFIDRHKWAIVGALAITTATAMYFSLKSDSTATLAADVNEQIWIDEDGHAFRHELVAFDDKPVLSPSGKPGFRAELCYWTREGKSKPKPTPTPVLLNSAIGKPGPTFCPDCDRLVTALNAPPVPGLSDDEQRPPPTRAEYESKSSTRP